MCSSSTKSPLQSIHSSDWENTFKHYGLDFKSNTQRSDLFEFLVSSRISFKTKSNTSSSSTIKNNSDNNTSSNINVSGSNIASTSSAAQSNSTRLQATDSEGI